MYQVLEIFPVASKKSPLPRPHPLTFDKKKSPSEVLSVSLIRKILLR